jgi:VanZ family protein
LLPNGETPQDRRSATEKRPAHLRTDRAPEARAGYGRVYLILLAIYAPLIVYGSLVPLRFRHVPLAEALRQFRAMRYLDIRIGGRADLVSNFLLFVPLSFVAMGALTRENRSRHRWAAAIGVGLAAAVLSTAIEFTQIYFPWRTVSQNDIYAEILGGIAGIVLWFCFGRRITDWARGLWRQRSRGRLAVKILIGYAVFLVLYQLFPFDLTIRPVELYRKLKGAKTSLVPFCDPVAHTPYGLVSQTVVMVPIGFLLALVQRPGGRHAALKIAVEVVLLAAMIEAAQAFVYSRYTSSTDVVLGVVGGALGAAATLVFGPTARRPLIERPLWRRCGTWVKLVATAALLGGLVWEKWHPFEFAWPAGGLAAGAREVLQVPFARQYGLSEFHAMAQFVRELVTFFLLGMLLRGLLSPTRRAGKIACGLLVVAAAVAFEFVQVLLPTRLADLTAMGVSSAGGVLGVWLLPGFVNVFLRGGTRGGASTRSGGLGRQVS